MVVKRKVAKKPAQSVAKEQGKKAENMIDIISGGFSDIKRASDKSEIHFMQSGMTSLNRAMRLGGLPVGCVYELHGPNAGGKTACLIGMLADAQKLGHATMLCDAERAANDKKWLTKLGLDLDNIAYFNPDSFESAAERINGAIIKFKAAKKDGRIPKDTMFFIGVDSVAKLTPQREIDGKVGDANFGLIANLMSQWLRPLTTLVGDKAGSPPSDVAVIFINHERVNVKAKGLYDKTWKSFGGEALQFEASVRLRITAKSLKDGEVVIGKEHTVLVEKNKVGEPFSKATFFTTIDGFDMAREASTEAIKRGMIKKPSKGKFLYKGEEIAGEKRLRAMFADEETLQELIDELNENVMDVDIEDDGPETNDE